MSQNLLFDPVKKDYIFENGSPVPTDRILEAAYFAIQIPKGAWVNGSPDEGSYIYTLANRKRTASIEQEYAAYAEQAIQSQLINTGKASAVQVFNLQTTRTGTENEIDVTPASTQLAQQLSFVPV